MKQNVLLVFLSGRSGMRGHPIGWRARAVDPRNSRRPAALNPSSRLSTGPGSAKNSRCLAVAIGGNLAPRSPQDSIAVLIGVFWACEINSRFCARRVLWPPWSVCNIRYGGRGLMLEIFRSGRLFADPRMDGFQHNYFRGGDGVL